MRMILRGSVRRAEVISEVSEEGIEDVGDRVSAVNVLHHGSVQL